MSDIFLPTPPQFHHSPELAVIAVLEASLQATIHALHAVHAPLGRAPRLPTSPTLLDSYGAATLLVLIADDLAEAIGAYRDVVDRERLEPADSDEFPF